MKIGHQERCGTCPSPSPTLRKVAEAAIERRSRKIKCIRKEYTLTVGKVLTGLLLRRLIGFKEEALLAL